MKHLNLELEKLEQRIAPWASAGRCHSNGSKSGGSKSGVNGSLDHGNFRRHPFDGGCWRLGRAGQQPSPAG